jgi:hypothetical protein
MAISLARRNPSHMPAMSDGMSQRRCPAARRIAEPVRFFQKQAAAVDRADEHAATAGAEIHRRVNGAGAHELLM